MSRKMFEAIMARDEFGALPVARVSAPSDADGPTWVSWDDLDSMTDRMLMMAADETLVTFGEIAAVMSGKGVPFRTLPFRDVPGLKEGAAAFLRSIRESSGAGSGAVPEPGDDDLNGAEARLPPEPTSSVYPEWDWWDDLEEVPDTEEGAPEADASGQESFREDRLAPELDAEDRRVLDEMIRRRRLSSDTAGRKILRRSGTSCDEAAPSAWAEGDSAGAGNGYPSDPEGADHYLRIIREIDVSCEELLSEPVRADDATGRAIMEGLHVTIRSRAGARGSGRVAFSSRNANVAASLAAHDWRLTPRPDCVEIMLTGAVFCPSGVNDMMVRILGEAFPELAGAPVMTRLDNALRQLLVLIDSSGAGNAAGLVSNDRAEAVAIAIMR